MKTINKYYGIIILKLLMLITALVSMWFFDNYKIACLALVVYAFLSEKLS